METTLRHIADELRAEAHLPADWKPNVLISQPGLGSSAYAERKNFAKMAFNSGKDFVISVDMTDEFKWPTQSGDLRMLEIKADVSRRFERVVIATKHVYGSAPDAVLESQATRLLAPGKLGSTTIPDLHTQGKLHPDFELNKVMAIGVPRTGMGMDEGFRHGGEKAARTAEETCESPDEHRRRDQGCRGECRQDDHRLSQIVYDLRLQPRTA
jgi:hypothetical protein